ncbi:MAG: hypothetical protein LBT53_09595 [Puniceicoccales bacterium]|jgi:alpha-L-rhamnosidase|nr:hypothetical protein [Puniceicoccales bacterium]
MTRRLSLLLAGAFALASFFRVGPSVGPFAASAAAAQTPLVERARPVWAEGREKEMNLTLGFATEFTARAGQKIAVKIAASTIYRVWLNGEFLGSGPARAAHGFYRVDEYRPAPKHLRDGANFLAIEVAGYNINSFYTLNQPSFLLSEVTRDGQVVAATGDASGETVAAFRAQIVKERVQKVERYSAQRTFTEYYKMEQEDYDWWRGKKSAAVQSKRAAVPLKTFPPLRLLPRHVKFPDFAVVTPTVVYSEGTFTHKKPERYYKNRSLTQIGPQILGFRERSIPVKPSFEAQEIVNTSQQILRVKNSAAFAGKTLAKDTFRTYDFGVNLTGFLGAKIKCTTPSRIFFYFDEMLTGDDVRAKERQGSVNNQIVYELAPGEYDLESIEAYTFRYLKILVTEGECKLEAVHLREFAYPVDPRATFVSSDEKLNAIYAAAVQTFRQNTVDVFMDCPSRERAGWLCDSYFTAIVEQELTGASDVARNFYENYALPKRFPAIPDGMLPMCYPADNHTGQFIPNWAMWFVLQVEDYSRRGGDPALVQQLRPRIEKLLAYFATYENTDGLLENLKKWIFVEWSQANHHTFVRPVNYPTNMLYSAALRAAANLYNNEAFAKKAEKIKNTILRQSYNGEFFIDTGLRENGKIVRSQNITEVCQYYAFFFDIATPETHPALWQKLLREFGPNRDAAKVWPNVHKANAFIGNYLRVDVLARHGRQAQLLSETRDYFYWMAERTGTLWEHQNTGASSNHGFASYIAHVLWRDVLGIYKIDYLKKEISVRFSDVPLASCAGSLPVGDGKVALEWSRANGELKYKLQIPSGYKVKIENRSKDRLIEK